MSGLANAAISATARSKAASFALEGTLKPLSVRTNERCVTDFHLGRRWLEVEQGFDVSAHG